MVSVSSPTSLCGSPIIVNYFYKQTRLLAGRAGLGTLAAMQELNARNAQPVQVRIGIHTGLVVMGEMGSGDKREQLA